MLQIFVTMVELLQECWTSSPEKDNAANYGNAVYIRYTVPQTMDNIRYNMLIRLFKITCWADGQLSQCNARMCHCFYSRVRCDCS
jgi:hypothetical protein